MPIIAHIQGLATHPEDDLILATAGSTHADYLVTGDRLLRTGGSIHAIPLVSPTDFLQVITYGGKKV